MKIEYYYSVASPYAYMGIDRFQELVKKYSLEVLEKPFDLVGKFFLTRVEYLFQSVIQLDKNIDFWRLKDLGKNLI